MYVEKEVCNLISGFELLLRSFKSGSLLRVGWPFPSHVQGGFVDILYTLEHQTASSARRAVLDQCFLVVIKC